MDQTIPSLALDDFLASLRNRTAAGIVNVALDGDYLPISAQLRPSSAVIFTFTGATNRKRFTLPRFSSLSLFDYVPASVISLSDPTLHRSEKLTLGWYAGYEGFPLQTLLPEFFQAVIDCLGATQVVFVGTSGGGFSALYYSWRIPGSIVMVSNPQTALGQYRSSHIDLYRKYCWPALENGSPLDSVIDTDVTALYAHRFNNMVIYLQVANDFFHLKRHLAPFVEAVADEHAEQLLLQVANWGVKGHNPAPAKVWIPWIKAALSAPELTASAIEATWSANLDPRLSGLEPIDRSVFRDENIAAELARDALAQLPELHTIHTAPS